MEAILWGLAALVWVEVVRDFYHVLAHHWTPLYRMHVIHHRVFRPDLTAVNPELYRRSQWQNDMPECAVMLVLSLLPGMLATHWAAWAGTVYTLSFAGGAAIRGLGIPRAEELTDITHRPGEFKAPPAPWLVNRTYHWRHHFDNQKAYYCGTLALVDKLMGTALSLKGKRIAVTGASGTMGRALLAKLQARGAKVVALTSSDKPIEINGEAIASVSWQVGEEARLADWFEQIDILVINHGINVHGKRDADAVLRSYEVNTFSGWRLMELFLQTVRTNEAIARKEVWFNTSEAEVSPALSPLYELSKRTLGDLITLRRLDAPCVIRKLILGPFKSNLNPIGIMSAEWVAARIVDLAVRDVRNIIVTVNPLTYLSFPLKELAVSTYFRLFTSSKAPRESSAPRSS